MQENKFYFKDERDIEWASKFDSTKDMYGIPPSKVEAWHAKRREESKKDLIDFLMMFIYLPAGAIIGLGILFLTKLPIDFMIPIVLTCMYYTRKWMHKAYNWKFNQPTPPNNPHTKP